MAPPHMPSSPEIEGTIVARVPFGVSTLKKRSQFLAASRARKQVTPGLILQARKRKPEECPEVEIRVGYTCSKKVGNAVARNRAKRRLRAAAHAVLRQQGVPGWDYVLIGRKDITANLLFQTLCNDLASALSRIHAP